MDLFADCSRCRALCCVALAFDRSPQFALTKDTGVPCSRLDARDRCTIHDERIVRGFSGCVAYDCHGAGQRATALFGERSWRDDDATARASFDAFRALREIHELLVLLDTARRLELGVAEESRRAALFEALVVIDTRAALAAFERGSLTADVRRFLRTLSGAVARRRLPIVA